MRSALKNHPNSRAKGKIDGANSVYKAIPVHIFQKTQIQKILPKIQKIIGDVFTLNIGK